MSTSKMQEKRVAAPSLLDLPLDVANLVMEKIMPEDRLVSRKVCQKLRAAIDKLGIGFSSIQCNVFTDEIFLDYSHVCSTCESIGYEAADNGGTLVTHDEKSKLIEEDNFVNVALEDMKILMKSQRISISLSNFKASENFVPPLINFFQTEECSQVKCLYLERFKFDDVISIIQCLAAKDPEDIEIQNPGPIDNFERITHLEQWKNAKKLFFNGFDLNSELIPYFFHFPEFTIHKTTNFLPEIAVKMRDDLLKRVTFENCFIDLQEVLPLPIVKEIAEVFKPDGTKTEDDWFSTVYRTISQFNCFSIVYSNDNGQFKVAYCYNDYKHTTILIVSRL